MGDAEDEKSGKLWLLTTNYGYDILLEAYGNRGHMCVPLFFSHVLEKSNKS